MMVQMLGVFGEFELEMIVERTRMGLAKKASKGEWTGGTPPFGYRYDLEAISHPSCWMRYGYCLAFPKDDGYTAPSADHLGQDLENLLPHSAAVTPKRISSTPSTSSFPRALKPSFSKTRPIA
jgi:hypothetical protein